MNTVKEYSLKLIEILSMDELQELVDNTSLCLPFYKHEGVTLNGRVSVKLTKAVNGCWEVLNKELTEQTQALLKSHLAKVLECKAKNIH